MGGLPRCMGGLPRCLSSPFLCHAQSSSVPSEPSPASRGVRLCLRGEGDRFAASVHSEMRLVPVVPKASFSISHKPPVILNELFPFVVLSLSLCLSYLLLPPPPLPLLSLFPSVFSFFLSSTLCLTRCDVSPPFLLPPPVPGIDPQQRRHSAGFPADRGPCAHNRFARRARCVVFSQSSAASRAAPPQSPPQSQSQSESRQDGPHSGLHLHFRCRCGRGDGLSGGRRRTDGAVLSARVRGAGQSRRRRG